MVGASARSACPQMFGNGPAHRVTWTPAKGPPSACARSIRKRPPGARPSRFATAIARRVSCTAARRDGRAMLGVRGRHAQLELAQVRRRLDRDSSTLTSVGTLTSRAQTRLQGARAIARARYLHGRSQERLRGALPARPEVHGRARGLNARRPPDERVPWSAERALEARDLHGAANAPPQYVAALAATAPPAWAARFASAPPTATGARAAAQRRRRVLSQPRQLRMWVRSSAGDTGVL